MVAEQQKDGQDLPAGGKGSPMMRGTKGVEEEEGQGLVGLQGPWLVFLLAGLSALHVHHPPGSELAQLPHQVGMSSVPGLGLTLPLRRVTVLCSFQARDVNLGVLPLPLLLLPIPTLSL